MVGHGMGNQPADRCTCRDAVAVLDGHAMRHKATHRKTCEEHAVEIDGILFGQRIQQCHQETRIIDIAVHQAGVPHRGTRLCQRLRNHDSPSKLISNLLKMELIVQSRDVIAQAMKEIQDRHCFRTTGRHFQQILALRTLPFKSLDL